MRIGQPRTATDATALRDERTGAAGQSTPINEISASPDQVNTVNSCTCCDTRPG
ncbi:hypothetical protein FHS29_005209 [Saccharothrix tamanrassetensis]|uniref:Uncharacterized protein n=1 Tax=Saccharothrix tamanrassetensis TaxID=1051531 RepID=A0A841CM01_9PSEU|nr:hypothetical protein [Saccharothrix tamanrassetensis]MBB5958601.1 hypothetical protein [Saccharothrix tamanrassetensis]